jgi:hypothetical protein
VPQSRSPDRSKLETLRRRYCPSCVQVLFVGESPPASGRFFYQGDSGLYRAMRDVFQAVDPSITNETFLEAFRDLGCYLVDLCPTPVDRLDPKSRRDACRISEPSLSRVIVRLKPQTIVTVVRSIEHNVSQAASDANWHGTLIHLPYPGRWSQHKAAFAVAMTLFIAEISRNRTGRRSYVRG